MENIDPKQILKNVLYHKDGFLPKDDIIIITKNKEKFYSLLIDEVNKCNIDRNLLLNHDYDSIILFMLIGDFMCHEVFEQIINIIKDENDDNEYFGEALFECIPGILTKIFNNDDNDDKLNLILNLIRDENISENVKISLTNSLELMEMAGKINILKLKKFIMEQLDYLSKLNIENINYDYCGMYPVTLFEICVHYHFEESLPLIKEIYNKKIVDETLIGDHKEFCKIWNHDPCRKFHLKHSEHMIKTDTINELCKWACYDEEDNDNKKLLQREQKIKEKKNKKPKMETIYIDTTTKKTPKPNRHQRKQIKKQNH